MSRRNQSRRRRAYGRRQHEVRERRSGPDASTLTGPEARDEWLTSDSNHESRGYGQEYGGFAS